MSAAGPENAPGQPRLTVLSGPSGVGKSSVVAELRRRLPEVFVSVSVTTRPARPGERDGEHYYFVDRPTFEQMAAAGELLEHAEYAGNSYGTLREPVCRALQAGRPALLEIEVQGARQVRAAMPDVLLVMLVPPSWEDLAARLGRRGSEGDEVLAHRLQVARTELDAAGEFDVTVVNDDVPRAAGELLTLIVGAGQEPADAPDSIGQPHSGRERAGAGE